MLAARALEVLAARALEVLAARALEEESKSLDCV